MQIRDQATRPPLKGKEPNVPAFTLPDSLSPSTAPLNSKVMGMGDVIDADQAMLLPSILPLASAWVPCMAVWVPDKAAPDKWPPDKWATEKWATAKPVTGKAASTDKSPAPGDGLDSEATDIPQDPGVVVQTVADSDTGKTAPETEDVKDRDGSKHTASKDGRDDPAAAQPPAPQYQPMPVVAVAQQQQLGGRALIAGPGRRWHGDRSGRRIGDGRRLSRLTPDLAVHRLVGEPVGVLVGLARHPLVRHPGRVEDAAGLGGERAHARVLDLPAAGHLLDDQLGVHPHVHHGVRVDVPGGAQPGDQAAVLGDVVGGGAEVLGGLRERLAGVGVADDGPVARGPRVAPGPAVRLHDEPAHHSPESGVRTRMRRQFSHRTIVSAGAARTSLSSVMFSSSRQPSHRFW